jgi:hypothetical protein
VTFVGVGGGGRDGNRQRHVVRYLARHPDAIHRYHIHALRVVPISPELFYALTLFVLSPARHLLHHSLSPLSRLIHILFATLFMTVVAVVLVALYFMLLSSYSC